MLVRSALRSTSISSAEHNANLASLLLIPDGSGPEPAPPAKPAGRGGAAALFADSNTSLPQQASPRERTNVVVNPPQHDLEKLQILEGEIGSLVLKIMGVERDVEEVQEAIASGSAYRGRRGEALERVEEKLVSKELLLREKERQLRDEKMILLRLQVVNYNNSRHKMSSGTATTTTTTTTPSTNEEAVVPAAPRRRATFVMTSACVDDPAGETAEQRRLTQVNEVIQRRRSTLSNSQQDIAGSTDAVITVHKIEEDSRLLARLGALEMPILVSTLLAGFTLVTYEIASTTIARQLAVLSFALESSASIVLCLIAFRGQQLYSHATDVKPLTRKFLRRVRPITVVALLAFSLGVVAFVLGFVLEASEELGSSWLAVVAVVFCPTLVAGVLFAVSTVQIKRYSFASAPEGSE